MPTTASALDLPFDEAISFFRGKTAVDTKAWTDVYGAAHARSFMVAGAAGDALLKDFQGSVAKALEEGTTLDDFRRDFDRIVETHGWSYKGKRGWRSRIIFETNLRTAYSAGRYALQSRPETLAAFPFWQYQHSGAVHPRKEHLAWDGLTLRADDVFWQTRYPPNGFRCGCFVTPVSPGGLKRQGKNGPDEAPELLFRAEEVGGVRREVPIGVDPSFEYNPGAVWLKQAAPGPRPVVATPEMIAAFVARALAEGVGGKGWVPVGLAPGEMATALRVEVGTEVRLSADTIASHVHHPEATPAAYATVLPRAIAEAELIERKGQLTVFVIDDDGMIWLVGLKRTRNGEIYVTTMHRAKEEQLRSHRRRGTVVRKGKDAPGGSPLPR